MSGNSNFLLDTNIVLGFLNGHEAIIQNFLALVDILPLSELVADKTIALRRITRLKLPDAIIAATAITHNLILVTCDKNLAGSSSELQILNPLI